MLVDNFHHRGPAYLKNYHKRKRKVTNRLNWFHHKAGSAVHGYAEPLF